MADHSLLGRTFDAYQNLTQISRCIGVAARQRHLDRPSRVLELSRRSTGLSDFLHRAELVRVATHVDNQPVLELPLRLPYDDYSFDACIVTDAYEHISAEYRDPLLAEMLRVTDGVVLLGCPEGDEIVDRFDKVVFDFIWGKYAEEFEPLAQHQHFGLEDVSQIRDRLIALGATSVATLPCNYVYRWIHQILVYFDLQHGHPIADVTRSINEIYNEVVSPYDYREPCYRYLLVAPTTASIDIAAMTQELQGPIEPPALVPEAEGALIEAFRSVESRSSDLLRKYVVETESVHAELSRLRQHTADLEGTIASLQADVTRLGEARAQAPAGSRRLPPVPPVLAPEQLDSLRAELASQQWTSHNVDLGSGLTTMPGSPDFFTSDTRLAAVRRVLTAGFGDRRDGLRVADLGCLEGGFAIALGLEGADVLGIEARNANLAKAELLRRHFGLDNVRFELADVKDFTLERFGAFDVVLALGIAYHLDRPAAWLRQIAGATRTLLIVDSHVAPRSETELAMLRSDIRNLSPLELELVGDRGYLGRWYSEFAEDISDQARGEQLWASWSNHRSFWLTEESLLQALASGGFDLVVQQHDATVGAYDYYRREFSRGMYVAWRTSTNGEV